MKVLKISFLMINILWIMWVLLSWIDVGFHNADPEPVYQAWNLIQFGGLL